MRDKEMTTPDVRIDEAGTTGIRPLLEIRDLAITFKTGGGDVQAVRNALLDGAEVDGLAGQRHGLLHDDP